MRYIKIFAIIIGTAFVINACSEDEIGPTIDLTGANFVSAELTNPSSSSSPVVLTADNATSEFEKFSWSAADFGVNVPVSYALQMDSSSSFSKPVNLAITTSTSASLTVDDFNDGILELGLPAFVQTTVSLRVRSTVVGAKVDTIYSNTITRTVTPFRLSDCGDFCTIGIIGDATAGGWDNDTDMRLADATGVDKSTWTVTIYLTAAAAKFRASDDWANNWGDAAFPSGTGTPDGPNIAISSEGWYKVTFNDKTGDYSFTALTPTVFTTIGIIGDATPGGWDTDTDMTVDGNDVHLWSGSIALLAKEAKFRAENDWANNWGQVDYPSGFGVGNGPNIPVKDGTFTVRFHDVTGEYNFMTDATVYTSVGIIGDATAGGWDADTDLIKDPMNPYKYSGIVTLTDGEVKFRADDLWDNNWGGVDFPSGVGLKNGANTPVTAGTYVVFFNSGTGEYRLLK